MKVMHPKTGQVVNAGKHGDHYLNYGWEEVKDSGSRKRGTAAQSKPDGDGKAKG